MAISSNLGFPRIGLHRELKKAVEGYWKGNVKSDELDKVARELRQRHWQRQKEAGIDHISSNDFSYYDQVLDMIATVGAVPQRYGFSGGTMDLETYFAMARGNDKVTAMEMTKWFDTNYHYIVPEFEPGQKFSLASTKVLDEYQEAKELGFHTRPVLIGPITFLMLGKSKDENFDPLDLLEDLLGVYEELLGKLAQAGAKWVQIDEPMLVTQLGPEVMEHYPQAYERLVKAAGGMEICLATYFGGLLDALPMVMTLPVAAVHLDLVRAPGQLDKALTLVSDNQMLSLGVINGRNIWKADLEAVLDLIDKAEKTIGSDRLLIAPSCSLLHTPIDLSEEKDLPEYLYRRLAYATDKLNEIAVLTQAVNKGRAAVAQELQLNKDMFEEMAKSSSINNPEVKDRLAGIHEDMFSRPSPFAQRKTAQQNHLHLPLLPTTTIGSFPQTPEIRKTRAAFRKGEINLNAYEDFLREEIKKTIREQEDLGLDVLVHGEAERTDMVEYFGQQLQGFAFTRNGWVQSYGSRCVKPPIIFGDVSRPEPMTVRWSKYAQSVSSKPMKGMLTGPITILQWSFVREDQPRQETAYQIALAIRDEVVDLEAAGIDIIQIDEPALREGLPLHKDEWAEYLDWAVKAFRLATSCAKDQTQIHTHMCYSEFNEIIDSIAALDADVISIEASRSGAELLGAFVDFNYPNDIGPGVYDIHSPRVPDTEEMIKLIHEMLDVLKEEQLWVNPDCGLKTRGWPETRSALKNMVAAAKQVREKIAV